MNLACSYLGHDLPHPFIVGASPMVGDLDVGRRLEDAGAAAIVMEYEPQSLPRPERLRAGQLHAGPAQLARPLIRTLEMP